MNKDEISKSYMESQKAQHPAITPVVHSVVVAGSDGHSNIGAAIATNFRRDGAEVIHFNKESIDLGRGGYPFKGHETVLVLANGRSYMDWIEYQPDGEIEEMLNDNLRASMRAARDFVKATIHTPERKTIIFIGSMAHQAKLNGSAVYCAVKAGLAHFARCLAWELAPKGYNVFCIHPSNTEGTPMTEETIKGLERYRHLTRQEAEAYWGASLPRHKWLQPQDIANLATFLASGHADYLSGADLNMGGGQR